MVVFSTKVLHEVKKTERYDKISYIYVISKLGMHRSLFMMFQVSRKKEDSLSINSRLVNCFTLRIISLVTRGQHKIRKPKEEKKL